MLRTSDAEVRNCTLHHFLGTGIQLEGAGITPLIADSSVTTTTGWAIYQNTMNMAPQYSHVALAGGGINALIIDGDTVTGAVTLDGTAARFTGGAPIIMRNSTFVATGATLTVAPGTDLRTPPGGEFQVREGGAMIAEGTKSSPIAIRANTATGAPGDWYYVLAQAGSTLRLSYCDFGFGGRNGNPALLLRTSDAQVHNCTLHDFAGTGIQLEGAGITPLVADTTVTTVTGWAIYQSTMNMAPQYSHVTLAGGGVKALVVDGDTVSGAVTLSGNAAKFTGRKPVILVRTTIVPAGATLTVEAGTELRTPPGGAFDIRDGGAMVAEGTASALITFRANTTTAAAGDWYYIDAKPGSRLRLKYCDIGYGGRNGNPALFVRTSDATIRNSVVHHALATGLQIEGAGITPTIADTRIESNVGWAIYQNTMNMAPSYSGVTLTGNGHDALLIDGDQVTVPVVLDPAGIGGKPIQLARGLAILSGASLTIGPGTQLRFPLSWAVEVRSGGALVAEGTPGSRIAFLPDTATPAAGAWYYVDAQAGSHLRLANVDLRYGGRNGNPTLRVQTADAIVTSCAIRESQGDGVWVGNEAALRIAENQVASNGFGVRNTNAKSWVDARFVWWGDPSGPYHAALNPDGKGNAVSDKVLFEPWAVDEAGTLSSSFVVQVRGPSRAASGETVDFSVYYATYVDLKDAVLAVTLPFTADYVPQSADATYQHGLRQVFWRLGDVPAGTEGTVPLRVRHGWGIPDGLKDELDGFLFGSNQSTDTETVDVEPYTSYTGVTPTGHRTLNRSEVDAAIAGSAPLKTLVDQAKAADYLLLGGSDISLSNGDAFVELMLIDKGRHGAMFLRRRAADGHVIRSVVTPTEYAIGDADGGLVAAVPDGPVAYWGTWAGAPSAGQMRAMATDPFLGCLRNCVNENLGMYVLGKVSKTIDQALQVKDCVQAVLSSGGDADAVANCAGEPGQHRRRKARHGQGRGAAPLPVRRRLLGRHEHPLLQEEFHRPQPVVRAALMAGAAVHRPGAQLLVLLLRREVGHALGAHHPRLSARLPASPKLLELEHHPARAMRRDRPRQGGRRRLQGHRPPPADRRADNGLRPQPHDPAARQGPQREVRRQGRRARRRAPFVHGNLRERRRGHGIRRLHPRPAPRHARRVDTPARGQRHVDSGGALDHVGHRRAGAQGRARFNRVRVVQRRGACRPHPGHQHPQPRGRLLPERAGGDTDQLGRQHRRARGGAPTGAGDRLPDRSGDHPRRHPRDLTAARLRDHQAAVFGALSGAAPALTYTPAAGFTGPDFFAFTVASATATSDPAQVAINVKPPDHDTTKPQVGWVWPANGQTLTNVAVKPTGEDAFGPLFAPFVQAEVDERVDPASVTAAVVSVVDRNGHTVPVGVTLDTATNRVVIALRERWRATTYTVTLTTAIKDLAGNALASPKSWSFSVESAIADPRAAALASVARPRGARDAAAKISQGTAATLPETIESRPFGRFFLRPLDILRRYRGVDLRPDAVAGLTVAIVAIPQSVAYAAIAGLPPSYGLYSAAVASIVGALWGSSRFLSTGPTNAASILVLSILAPLVPVRSPEFLVAASLMAVLVGLLRVALGVARLGFLVNFASRAVLLGFTAGAAVLIAAGQLPTLLHLHAPPSARLIDTITHGRCARSRGPSRERGARPWHALPDPRARAYLAAAAVGAAGARLRRPPLSSSGVPRRSASPSSARCPARCRDSLTSPSAGWSRATFSAPCSPAPWPSPPLVWSRRFRFRVRSPGRAASASTSIRSSSARGWRTSPRGCSPDTPAPGRSRVPQ